MWSVSVHFLTAEVVRHPALCGLRGSEETDCLCDPGHILLSLTQHLLLKLAALGELKTTNAASAIKIVG